MSLFGRILRRVRLVDLRHRAALGGFYRDHFSTISSRISMFAKRIMSTATTETLFKLLSEYRRSTLFVRVFVVEIRRRYVSAICSRFSNQITVRTSFGLYVFYGILLIMDYAYGLWTVTLLLIREHLFVKRVCYLSIFEC